MESKGNGVRFFVIAISLIIAWSCLKPTYDWYYQLDEHSKSLASITKQHFKELTANIEKNVQYIREAVISSDNYKLALSDKDLQDQNFALDIGTNTKNYILNIDAQSLEKVVKNANNTFSDWKKLKETYNHLKAELLQMKMIKKYQQTKSQSIKLGLDIAGGVHFVLGIDTNKMKKQLDSKYLQLMNPNTVKKQLLKNAPDLKKEELANQIQKKINSLKQEKKERLQQETDKGVEQALIKIVNRIDQFGVAEPTVLKGPNNTIIVELPGKKDIQNAKSIFTRVGQLNFQVVDEEWMRTVPVNFKDRNGNIVNYSFIEKNKNNMPEGSILLPVQGTDKFGQITEVGFLAVRKKIELSGSYINDAKVEFSRLGESNINFFLTIDGAETFGNLTQKNINKRLAIVMDNVVQSAPNIREPIMAGNGSISGSFSKKEASILAAILRSGSLPVPLKIEEERVIGPSLGKQEVLEGVQASLTALIILSLFLFLYYGFFGGLSITTAQIMNLILILAVMAQLKATLTLPGIGAIVLTIGMSVDANVIIHERIKEFFKEGFSLQHAIHMGYESAFRTILDSNLTTLIPSLVLSIIGDGPIRGFGITLMIGLVINLFTSIFITRFLFNFFLYKIKVNQMLGSHKYGK